MLLFNHRIISILSLLGLTGQKVPKNTKIRTGFSLLRFSRLLLLVVPFVANLCLTSIPVVKSQSPNTNSYVSNERMVMH